jgi:menaquinone-dependent protoporphyrinogen oxidase
MDHKVLVAYATRAGSTAEVAKKIAEIISAKGLEVEVLPVKKVKDLSPYRAVIVGSAVRAAQWLPEAIDFVEINKKKLCEIPTAFFTVSLTASEKTEASLKKVASFVDPVRNICPPKAEAFFAGKMDPKTLSVPTRIMIRAMKTQHGDYRDWEAVQAWTEEAFGKLALG